MPRPLRHFHPGGIYHITHRGHNKFHIFEETIDKAFFLDILRKVVAETGCHVLYYTIMDNHYHLLIEMQEMPLDKVMQRLNTRYAMYYAKKANTSGTIFSNRFFAQEIPSHKYLTTVIQYMAINPIKAGLVQKIPDYRWCAHTEIVSRKQEIIHGQRLYELIGKTIERGKSAYVELIIEAQKKIERAEVIPISQSGWRQIALEDQLIRFLASQNNKPTLSQIRSTSRDPLVQESRRTFARIACAQGYPINDIAKTLNVCTRSVYNWCKNVAVQRQFAPDNADIEPEIELHT